MKTNPKHLQILDYILSTYVGIHPENRMGEVQFDVLYFYFTDSQFPNVNKVRINHGLLCSKVSLWVDYGPAKPSGYEDRYEHHRLEISNADIRERFPEAAKLAKAEYKRLQEEAKQAHLVGFNTAVERLMSKRES